MIENVEVQQAIPFIPMLISGLLRAGQAGVSAFQANRANRREATAAALRRNRFMNLINRIRNRDTSGLDAQASDVFSRAADQIEANAASRGVLRAPNAGAPRQLNEAFASVLANLAEQKAADQREAQRLEGELLSDPSFGVPDPNSFGSPFSAGLAGGLSGFIGGAGETFSNFLGTDAGIDLLSGTSRSIGLTPNQVRFNDRYQNRNMGR